MIMILMCMWHTVSVSVTLSVMFQLLIFAFIIFSTMSHQLIVDSCLV